MKKKIILFVLILIIFICVLSTFLILDMALFSPLLGGGNSTAPKKTLATFVKLFKGVV